MSHRLSLSSRGLSSLITLSLAALTGLAACGGDGGSGGGGGGGGGGGNPPNTLSVEDKLPDGRWFGTLERSCTVSGKRSILYDVRITGNEVVIDFDDGAFYGTALDRFQYTAKGAANWLGLQAQTIGTCAAKGGEMSCGTLADQVVQEDRTMTFFTDSLRWHAVVTSVEEVCTTEGDLARL